MGLKKELLNRSVVASPSVNIALGLIEETFSNQNLLLNGDFQVWQRGTSFSATANQYTADRWRQRYDDLVQKTSTGMQVTNELLQTSNRQEQSLPIDLRGQTITASFYAKTNAGTMRPSVGYKNTGGSDVILTGTADGFNDNEITTTLKKFYITFTVASDGSSGFVFRLYTNKNPTGGATDIFIEKVKLEYGIVATQFVSRPYSEELRLCRFFYERQDYNSKRHISYCFYENSTDTNGFITYDEKYQTPTIAVSSNGAVDIVIDGIDIQSTSYLIEDITKRSATLAFSSSGAGFVPPGCGYYRLRSGEYVEIKADYTI